MVIQILDLIDRIKQEVRPEDDQVYTKMDDLAESLPDSSPRFILLSYPLTLVNRPLLPEPPSDCL